MSRLIQANEIADYISDMLGDFAEDVAGVLQTSSEQTAKETVKELKQTSPKKSGKYAKSWKVSKLRTGLRSASYVVHARAPHYRLTHLLEYGHAKKKGGRTRAFPHIAQAEGKAIQRFQRKLREGIERVSR
ncbi:MAG: HK97 gp10 family phage protein [Peptostreptococcaceae bacterium]|nr:HK97 gp10 family phage protein [Peptostreptococcaceae bacterium]